MEPLFYENLFPNILLTKKIYDCTSIQVKVITSYFFSGCLI